MLRIIFCQQCSQAIREEDLFTHLVREHHWKPARREVSSTNHVSADMLTQPKKRQPAPRLGPMKPSVSSASFAPEVCKHCRKQVDPKLMTQHLIECKAREKAKLKAKELKRASEQVACPHCSQLINSKNLDKHIKKVHPAFAAANTTTVAKPTNKALASAQCQCPYCKVMISEKRYLSHVKTRCPKSPIQSGTVRLPNTCHDPAIAAYLARVPTPDETGKYGKPQAKIRHGTYGLSNMEYDAWGRNE